MGKNLPINLFPLYKTICSNLILLPDRAGNSLDFRDFGLFLLCSLHLLLGVIDVLLSFSRPICLFMYS